MKSKIFILAIILGISSCKTTKIKNIRDTSNAADYSWREKEAKAVVDKFAQWHNRFFSAGNTETVSKEVLNEFFAEDLYFEFNGRPITNDLDGMLKGYERIKAKDKVVIIEAFEDVKFRFPSNEITEVIIKHDTTSIEKDNTKKVAKATVSFFVKDGKIFRYIEKFEY